MSHYVFNLIMNLEKIGLPTTDHGSSFTPRNLKIKKTQWLTKNG